MDTLNLRNAPRVCSAEHGATVAAGNQVLVPGDPLPRKDPKREDPAGVLALFSTSCSLAELLTGPSAPNAATPISGTFSDGESPSGDTDARGWQTACSHSKACHPAANCPVPTAPALMSPAACPTPAPGRGSSALAEA